MRFNRAGALATGAIAVACLFSLSAVAQAPAPAAAPIAKDSYQRSVRTYEFRKAAQSGPERGREIFYYKCWFCHNEFTKNAPQLTGLYARGTLLSGLPVNDDEREESHPQRRRGHGGLSVHAERTGYRRSREFRAR